MASYQKTIDVKVSHTISAKDIHMDASTWMLLLTNMLTIVLALYEKWDIGSVMWIYWIQSVIIGVFQFIKILDQQKFLMTNVQIDNQPALPTVASKYFIAIFFAFHYGFFHFGYLTFLVMFFGGVKLPLVTISSLMLLFAGNHLYSFLANRARDRQREQSLGAMMFKPYARIIPMHLTILFGGFLLENAGSLVANQLALIIFLVIKTGADLIMHQSEHQLLSSQA